MGEQLNYLSMALYAQDYQWLLSYEKRDNPYYFEARQVFSLPSLEERLNHH